MPEAQAPSCQLDQISQLCRCANKHLSQERLSRCHKSP